MNHPAAIWLFHRLFRIPWLSRTIWFLVAGLALGAAGAAVAHAQAHRIESAPPGLIETGVPRFEVRTYQSLGLDAPPTDLHVMPDGRLLLLAGSQFAIGDGVRWERFRQEDHPPAPPGRTVAVAADGSIYMGARGGFGQIVFEPGARWRLRLVAPCTVIDSGHVPFNTAIQVGDDWFWRGDGKSLVAWRPGQTARLLGQVTTTDQMFRLHDAFYISERGNGRLWRFAGQALEPVEFKADISENDTLTCAVPFGPDRLLVGTHARGLKLFNGAVTEPFLSTGFLNGDAQINALCETAGGLYAAAVENYGLVFFDRQGRAVETLDRSLDPQLNHIQRLCAAGGVIVGLLGEGIVRVEFPSRISYFEPLTDARMSTSLPYRFDGRLWLLADGKMHRAVYDPSGRLNGFEVDSPPERFCFSFHTMFGVPVATTQRGAFMRTERGWMPFAPDSCNMRILEAAPRNGRWLYAALHELGWLRPTPAGIEVERIEAPGIVDDPNNSETDSDGSIWIEQGYARLARVRIVGDRPVVESFDRKDGIPEGWVQVYSLDGHIGFNIGGQIYYFVEATRRIELDEQFARDYPGLADLSGRPVRDALGRIWIYANGSVQVLAGERGHLRNLAEEMPPGFQPYYFTCESNGVVWMHSDRRLARFDPSLPPSPSPPFRALITSLSFSNSGRTEFSFGRELSPIDFDDSSFAAHFVAPACPFGMSVDFDVKLDGADSRWASSGGSGSTVFNSLKQGRYVLHVRPRAGGETGAEATLAFTVLPPWYLTRWAYAGYAIGVFGLASLIVHVTSFLQRREKARLERLVEERTQELNAGIERRHRLEAQLQQSQKLESLGTLAGGIAHDFNNLLTSILGHCELAGLSIGDPAGLQADLQEIRTAGLRAKDLVAQILTFSRQRNVTLAPIDLSAPVAEAIKLIRASTPATVEIVTRLASGVVNADATQIHQIVINLCNNAVHAMRSRPGLLEVSLDRVEVADSLAAEIPYLRTGPAMRLTVADTGSGINAATLERIFDPFFTTKQPGEGTGLGLAIVQGIVRSHNGAVRVRSTPGSGATFELFFPIAVATPAEPPHPGAAPQGQGEEILVVDDERAIIVFLEQRLKRLGYRPTVFSDPRAALAEVVKAPRRFQAIVTDLTMPGLTGVELIEQCRAAGADLPAIIVTGYGTDALKILPRCTTLSKPFAGDDLVRALASLLGKKTR